MSIKLTVQEIEFITERLQAGEPLPDDMRYKLFPTRHKEYELAYGGKMRKEDILANEDGVSPAPLQVEKVFNGEREAWPDGWRNLIVFGDNLQFLKTCYENRDEQIKDKVKGKVKLIYIDPPFATESDFKNGNGQTAYKDKTKGAEFVEFIRRRLILAKEILAPDGSIFVHLDQKMCHHIRVIMDEIFGRNHFQNQVIWQGTSAHNDAVKKYGNVHQVIYWYYNDMQPTYNHAAVRDNISDSNLKEYSKLELKDGTVINYKGNEHLIEEGARRFRTVDATWKGTSAAKQYTWRGCRPNSKREWRYLPEDMDAALERGELYLSNPRKGAIRCMKRYFDQNDGQILQDIWINSGRMSGGTGAYPTEKPEELLKRIIASASNEGDLILDFFGGGGTTAAVAEKLGRKWITCDIGKLSFYTIQRRLLNIQHSKDLVDSKVQYSKPAKSFVTLNTGHYDLEKVFKLEQDKYRQFVMDLFEIKSTPGKKVGGIAIDGERADGFLCHIFPYWHFKDATVDEEYLLNLSESLGKKAGSRFYIVAPVNYVDFISDYYQIEHLRYYFLKVPYHIIKELHKQQFKKFRQPQSQRNVNDLEDAVGFHFMRQPTVISELIKTKETVQIKLKEFRSHLTEENTGRELLNFESLAMVLIDRAYDDKAFNMDTFYFAQDLLSKKKIKKSADVEESEEELAAAITEKLLQQNELIIPPLPHSSCGDAVMVIYIDIYGNEFKEIFQLKK